MENLSLLSAEKPEKPFQNWLLVIGKWLIILFAYSFLVYKLITFNHYKDFFRELSHVTGSRFLWLLLVFLLLPFNWFFESLKWKLLVAKIQKISLLHAFKSYLAGISTGFFTPNRVGELVGRIIFLKSENRQAGTTLSVINSLTQNIIMAFCGIPAALIFFLNKNEKMNVEFTKYINIVLIFLLLFGVFYFLLPVVSKKFIKNSRKLKLDKFIGFLSEYKFNELLKILGITILRYIVFCIQFYAMLHFFGVELTTLQALIAIPTTYLFVSFTPSVAFSEAAVRSSYAVIFIGSFIHNELAILLAGVSIWAVNFIVPMLIGSVIMIRKK